MDTVPIDILAILNLKIWNYNLFTSINLYDCNLVEDMENGLKKISIATFNVHMWYDGDYVENFDRVLKLVRVSLRAISNFIHFVFKEMNCLWHKIDILREIVF